MEHENRDVVCSSLEFCCANPLRVSMQNYLTGSCYLTKRALWRKYHQNEQLFWEDYEDIEYGQRLWECGIPSVINPYDVTQSLYGRSMILGSGVTRYEKPSGRVRKQNYYLPLLHGEKKPAIKMTLEAYRKKYQNFCKEYRCESCASIPMKNDVRVQEFFRAIFAAVYDARVTANPVAVRKFVSSIEKNLLATMLSPFDVTLWTKRFCEQAEHAKYQFIHWEYWLSVYAVYQGRKIFMSSVRDFFPSHSFFIRAGILLSAWRLWRQNGEMFFHRDGFWGYVRSIWNSTPFVSGGTRR